MKPSEVGGAQVAKPAAQYLRMSSRQQRTSIALQQQSIADFCAREGYQIVQTYTDAGRSGLSTKGRTALKALLRDVLANPGFSTVIVADVSRWGRYQDPDEAAHYEFLCRSAGVGVRYCTHDFDEDGSPTATLVKSVQRLLAAEFSLEKSQWSLRGQGHNRRLGGWVCGEAPFGFSREAECRQGGPGRVMGIGERRTRLDGLVRLVWGPPEEVAAVRRIFQLYVRDVLSVAAVTKVLNLEAVATRRRMGWTTSLVRKVLRNHLVTGVLVQGRTRTRLGHFSRVVTPSSWTRTAVVKPMISKACFGEAQARLVGGGRFRNGDRELLADLQRLLDRHGTLNRQMVRSLGRFPPNSYVARFGSLQAAFRQVGFERRVRDAQHVEALGPDEMIARVRRLLAETGYLSAALLNKRGDVSSAGCLRQAFGSLDAVYTAVGFTTDRSEQLRLAWQRRADRDKQTVQA